ncbi:MAG TPA: PQ-loop domain-containing transporter [Acidimicrobiales bacterium]|nr:PQ-loop domain-containing transporter [Acidimicrobiales bacterium]
MRLSTALAVTASVIFLARLAPQPWRVLRTGQVDGVSALAALNAFVADVAWLAYGLSAGISSVWLVSIPAAAASMLSIVVLRRTIRPRDLVASGAWLAAVLLGGVTGHLALALAATVLVTCGPSLWAAYATRQPVGVASATWWIAIADAATWGAYGVVIGDVALELYGVVLVVTAVAILVRLRVRRVPAVAAPLASLVGSPVAASCAGKLSL